MMEGKKLRGNKVWIANMRGLVCKGYKFSNLFIHLTIYVHIYISFIFNLGAKVTKDSW